MLRVGFVSLCESEILMRFWLSNQVGLWYNLQLYQIDESSKTNIKFQTKLDCGIICNSTCINLHNFCIFVSNQVGLWYNLQPYDFSLLPSETGVSNQVGLWYNLQQSRD